MFAAAEPEEMLIEEVETLWADIAADDDWSAFEAKLARLETARQAWDFPFPVTLPILRAYVGRRKPDITNPYAYCHGSAP
jgi:hypothetical protein